MSVYLKKTQIKAAQLVPTYYIVRVFVVWNRLTTFEYIVRQRHRQDNRDTRKPAAVKETAAPSVDFIKVRASHDMITTYIQCLRTKYYTN